MPTPNLGAGRSPMGLSPYGFGSPAETDKPLPATLGSGRRIDPIRRDYVLDANGAPLMMSTVQQLVYLAVFTKLGSSIEPDNGLAPFPPVINEQTADLVAQTIRNALDFIVKDNRIEILSVDVERVGDSALITRTRFRDLTTGVEEVFEQKF